MQTWTITNQANTVTIVHTDNLVQTTYTLTKSFLVRDFPESISATYSPAIVYLLYGDGSNNYKFDIAVKDVLSPVIDDGKQLWDTLVDWITAAPSGTPSLTDTEIAFGDASNLMTSSPDLKFNNTESGVQSIVNVATSPGYATGQKVTVNFANGTNNVSAFGSDVYLNVLGEIGSGQAAGVNANTDIGFTAQVGIYTCLLATTVTANGSTINIFEGVAVNAFENHAAINEYYGFYGGGLLAGTGAVTNQYGLYLENMDQGGTNSYAIFTNLGKVHLGGITAFANNAAALAGGLVAGDLYYTDVGGDGILKIVI